ncbi:MAG: DEAD/DEAH box helicase [Sandaracinaceae bacterium]|nr:DEAD/DEAH box helicase [Sandaracinaceae bacterium]
MTREDEIEELEDELDADTETDDEEPSEPEIDPAIHALPAPVARAFLERRYTSLTAVQRAVLDPALAERDLRISSQTGSGKTAALGLVLLPLVSEGAPSRPSELPPAEGQGGRAHMTGPREAGPRAKGPRALVLAPTRELARQLEEELSWLYQHLGARVAVLSGGASYRDEHRALARGPAVIVGTPGRLLDHLGQGSFDPSAIEAVVLDEADQMLDLGFADELDQILSRLPDERRTHLVSATFPPEVLALADRVQREPVAVQGTRLGVANADIEHVVHLVDPHERVDALVNVLLAHGDARTLVFTRTRAGAQEIAELLHDTGFRVAHLSGELAQRERTRTLAAFKDGSIRALVATDVAARGIDVSDVGLVIHVEAPTSPEAYTHRSGRTGRAGKRGTSAILAAPRELNGVSRVMQRARIAFRLEPLPDAASLVRLAEDRAIEALGASTREPSDRARSLADRIPADADFRRIVASLVDRSLDLLGPMPRDVRVIRPPPPRAQRSEPQRRPFDDAPPSRRPGKDEIVPFVVTWGGRDGADPRRVLAMVCRRGDITRREIGGIHIFPGHTVVEVVREAADHFAQRAGQPDPRDRRVKIEPYVERGGDRRLRRR